MRLGQGFDVVAKEIKETAAFSAAEKSEQAAQAVLVLAKTEFNIAESRMEAEPSEAIRKALNELDLKKFTAEVAVEKAAAVLVSTGKNQTTKNQTQVDANAALTASKVALKEAKVTAKDEVDEEKIQNLYKHFGTHYISKVSYGRQLFVLITLDRAGVTNKTALGGGLQLKSHAIESDTNFKSELERIKEQVLVDIRVVSDGLKPIAIKGIKDMDDIQATILEFFDPDNHMAAKVV